MMAAGRVARRAIGLPGRASAELRAAAAFLTRVPLASPDREATGAAAFGLVGGLIGVGGAIVLLLVGPQAPLAAGALAVGAIALVSGGLHLDGLADTADALAAPTAEAATRARRDPRVGAAGAAAIAVAVLVDASLLASIVARAGPATAGLACLAATSGSRAVPVIVAALVRARAARTGSGGWFAERTDPAAALVALLSAVALAAGAAAVAGRPGLLVGAVGGMIVAVAVAEWLARARSALDGDGFGALVEVGFAAILLVTVVAL
jgi:adenosylcobinamide-GDP ribazoletransferase